MSESARAELRRFGTLLLNSFVAAVEERSDKGPVKIEELRYAATAIESSPMFARLTDTFYRRIVEETTRHVTRLHRRDPFKRLIVHPMAQNFVDEQLSRDVLPGYFSFIHLVMGDEVADLTQRCETTVDEIKGKDEDLDWDMFYRDRDAKIVLWTVLMRIADTFKRFEARRDWFINLMQTRPQAVSLASNAFIPLPATHEEEKPSPFGLPQFVLMFECLFGPARNLSTKDRQAFQEAFSVTPEAAFGALWQNIDSTPH